MLPLVQDKATTTLATVGGISISDVSGTLTLAAFKDPTTGLAPTYKIVVVFDPANPLYPTRFEQVRLTVSGTTITQMERNFGGINTLGPQIHDQGCEVRLVMPGDYINNLITHSETGYCLIPSYIAITYVSATSFTIVGDWTTVFSKTDKLRLVNVTTKYFHILSTSVASNVTTVTLIANNDYGLVSGAITSVNYSKLGNPSGFPSFFNYTPTWSTSGTAPVLGTGTLEGRYRANFGQVAADIFFSPTAATTYGTGAFRFAMPTTLTGTVSLMGTYRYLVDAGTGTAGGFVSGSTSTSVELWSPTGVFITMNGTAPFTWGGGNDSMSIQTTYYL